MGDVLVGLDGGGTHTRVLVADVHGTCLGYGEDAGCNPEYEPVETCIGHAKGALRRALENGAVDRGRVCSLAAGIAGLTSVTGSAEWAHPIAGELGLGAQVTLVGDSKVAQVGAFGGAPGVVVAGGTGSIVFAVTDSGREICNFDLQHNAQAGAWWLSQRLITRIAAEEDADADGDLVGTVLAALGFADRASMREAMLGGRVPGDVSLTAPLVTEWATRGAPLARAICEETAKELARGVWLMAPYFRDPPISVAAIGSVASSPYMQAALGRFLADDRTGRFRLAPPLYPPVVGAVLLASQRAGRPLDPDAARQLAQGIHAARKGCGLRPDNLRLAQAARDALRMDHLPAVEGRTELHAAPGRAVERLTLDGRTVVAKWRSDRATDREALCYRALTACVLDLLGAARLLGATSIGGVCFLFLECVDGTQLDWDSPRDVTLASAYLGSLHRATADLIAQAPSHLVSREAHAELFYEGHTPGAEPLVLDPGDLHAANFLVRADGSVCMVDFENMAVRPRIVALRQLREDASLPKGALAELALATYWRAAGWDDDLGAFTSRLFRA